MFQLVKRVIPSGQVFKGQLPLVRARYIFSKIPILPWRGASSSSLPTSRGKNERFINFEIEWIKISFIR